MMIAGVSRSRFTRSRRPRAWRARGVALLALSGLLLGCASLPSLEGREESRAIEPVAGHALTNVVSELQARHPGLSGVYALRSGYASFAARAGLMESAARSLDVQMYIWRDDTTGLLLFGALRQAADRGVRVRLLLDDNNTSGLDALLAVLDSHPGIEVRLFNPFVQRKAGRLLGFATDFGRLNRRMHNKTVTADGVATILGGRNHGDEYFSAGEGAGFVDLDVLAVGPVVRDVARSFDDYWASRSAYPVDRLLPRVDANRGAAEFSRLDENLRSDAATQYIAELRRLTLVRDLLAGTLNLDWVRTRLIVDPPAKALGQAPETQLIASRLERALGGQTERNLDLVSAYLVPGRRGMRVLTDVARRGAKLRILTNALESTDVAAVHSGYAKYRRALLRNGAQLYEFKRTRGPARARVFTRSGSSDASLHSKTLAIDGERIFIGSFNFDLRSADLNTELGLLMDSPRLAGSLADSFEMEVPLSAYRVEFGPNGRLRWVELREGAAPIYHTREPGASLGRRIAVRLLSWLPIDGLL
jgi:cardiolipin synthase C